MWEPAALLAHTTDQLLALHHEATLELLRRFPPSWPTIHAYNVARRVFDATRDLHQAITSVDVDNHDHAQPPIHIAPDYEP
jgi:hypothetical protein